MDFKNQTVGICWCFCNFPYKTFMFLIYATNVIRSIIYAFSPHLFTNFYPISFFQHQEVYLSFYSFGNLFSSYLYRFGILSFILSIVNTLLLLISKKVISILIIPLNMLNSILDLLTGTTIILYMVKIQQIVDFFGPISFTTQYKNGTYLFGGILILLSIYGFYLTYLLNMTIKPLIELIHAPKIEKKRKTIKEALREKHHRQIYPAHNEKYIICLQNALLRPSMTSIDFVNMKNTDQEQDKREEDQQEKEDNEEYKNKEEEEKEKEKEEQKENEERDKELRIKFMKKVQRQTQNSEQDYSQNLTSTKQINDTRGYTSLNKLITPKSTIIRTEYLILIF